MHRCKILLSVARYMNVADINECKTNNGGCDQKCTDTEGSFYCDCKIGYRLGYDQLSCIRKLIRHIHACNT